MGKLPNDRGMGWIEWILIAILAVLVLITLFYLLQPALVMAWQSFLQSLQ
jgi:hypothetical protein